MGQIVANSTEELAEAYFASPEASALISTWGLHLDFGPDVSGGAMFPFAEVFADMEAGMAIAEGGASGMVGALAGLIQERGGEVRTRADVQRIRTQGNRAVGVDLVSGEQISARRAIVGNLTPRALFGRLLAHHTFASQFRRKVARYLYGPGTMMVHLALSGKLPWASGDDLDQFAYVHLAPYVEDLDRTYTQSLNGYLPTSPLLIVGQTSAVDPTRAPGDQQVLWIQVRTLPPEIVGDAAGQIEARTWDEAKEPYADRVMQKLEAYAPGTQRLVLERKVFSPLDLERENPNLVGGDSLSGSHHLRQNFMFRPFPGWSNYRTPIQGLYMVGASTWPGAGTNALSGYLGAQEILRPYALRDRALGSVVALGAAGLLGVMVARKLRDRQ